MATTLSIVTAEDLAQRDARIERLEKLLEAYVSTQQEWLTTEQALKTSGIKTRETLEKYARATAPDIQQPGRITYRKQGVGCRYARTSCIDYAQRKLGQPALAA
jgi:hypothetical protein